jgi:hypothetical protein
MLMKVLLEFLHGICQVGFAPGSPGHVILHGVEALW